MIEKGIINFIKQKLEHSVQPEHIKQSLLHAGFPESQIDEAFEYVRKNDTESHRRVVAENGFLPPLHKSEKMSQTGLKKEPIPQAEVTHSEHSNRHKGLFAGRLLRRDFILGFLFFFGLGYIVLVFVGVIISSNFPDFWATIVSIFESENQELLFIAIPLAIFPITIILLSLMARRFHNIGLPGGLSLVFFVLCISPVGELSFYGVWAMYLVVIILFILLITKKGDTAPNEYGPYPSSKGSFFKRIFNV